MGTFGVAVFADDVAMDVRADWRQAVLDGKDPAEATAALEAAYADPLANAEQDDSIVFWLALALAQMETGRLLDRVRDRAVAIIDAGGDVERWRAENPGVAQQRAKVLDRLRAKLVGPQPAPKRLRRPPAAVPFDIGDLVWIHDHEFDRHAPVLVVDQHEEQGGKHPVVEWLIWDGTPRRTKEEIAHFPIWRHPDGRPFLFLVSTHDRDEVFGPHIGEVAVKGVIRPPSGDYRLGVVPFGAPCVTVLSSWPDLVAKLRPHPGDLMSDDAEA